MWCRGGGIGCGRDRGCSRNGRKSGDGDWRYGWRNGKDFVWVK